MGSVAKKPAQSSTRDARGRWLPGTPPPAPGFPKGQSGNPGGLPKTVAEIRKLALSHSPRALDVLVKTLDSDDEAHRMTAAMAVLDRAGVRPIAAEGDKLEVTGDAGAALGRLAALLARRATAAGETAGAVGGAGEPHPG
jgi:hypothetical protein